MPERDDDWTEPVDEPGAWVNWTRVELGRDEFVLDFGFVTPGDQDSRTRILVARLACSARTLARLHREIERVLSRYAEGKIDEEFGDDTST